MLKQVDLMNAIFTSTDKAAELIGKTSNTIVVLATTGDVVW